MIVVMMLIGKLIVLTWVVSMNRKICCLRQNASNDIINRWKKSLNYNPKIVDTLLQNPFFSKVKKNWSRKFEVRSLRIFFPSVHFRAVRERHILPYILNPFFLKKSPTRQHDKSSRRRAMQFRVKRKLAPLKCRLVIWI